MKRIRRPYKYKRFQRKRSRAELVERRHRRLWLSSKRRSQLGLPRGDYKYLNPERRVPPKGYLPIVAPSVLSMVANPEETLSFIDKLARHYESRKQVFVELKKVARIEYDAIVVLLAAMVRFKAADIDFNGDLPDDRAARKILMKSKFFESLYRDFAEQDRYEIGQENGIYTHANRNVDPVLSSRIIERASQTVWGERRRSQWVQRVFLELMQNTNNHASLRRQGENHWWLSVNHRADENTVSFTFVDFGVGVFQSLDNKRAGSKWFEWRTALWTVFRPTDNAEIFRLMLEGQFHRTVTGKYYRGKGLPGIREVMKRNGVSKLRIITNDVYADVANDQYRLLAVPFSGTMVYWELDRTNKSSAELSDV